MEGAFHSKCGTGGVEQTAVGGGEDAERAPEFQKIFIGKQVSASYSLRTLL